MALVGYRNSIGEVSFKCGGSLISKRHVLTGLLTFANVLRAQKITLIFFFKFAFQRHIASEKICKFYL